ncbi:MAG: hypothetical protein ACRCS8_01835 [Brevinema sp.]
MRLPLFLLVFVSINTVDIFANTDESSWVSVANEYITIAMETNTGRYLMFDNASQIPALNLGSVLPASSSLKALSPLPSQLDQKASVLGKTPDALNFATLNINGSKVVFGSASGSWVSDPVVEENRISYAWKIGDVEIIQTLSIATNIDTQYEDALTVEYTVINDSTSVFNTVEARVFLDPTVNREVEIPFFLLDNKSIAYEQEYLKNTMPDFWLAADPQGNISSSSLKSPLKSPSLIAPSRMYLTSMDRAIKSEWDFSFERRYRISKKDSVVLMYFDSQSVPPQDSRTIVSFQVAKPALMNTLQNNGLQVMASSFATKNTTPMTINVWVLNNTNTAFDNVDLTLKVPSWIKILDAPTKRVGRIDQYNAATSVSWTITSKESKGRTADLQISVDGKVNRAPIARLQVPITVNLEPEFQSNNQKTISRSAQKTAAEALPTPPAEPVATPEARKTTLANFLPEDTAGATSESLNALYQRLKNIKTTEAQEIVKLIETEYELMKEIAETEKNISEINKQYEILLGVYQSLYQDEGLIDRSYINIQEISNNIKKTQDRLRQHEAVYSNTVK